ncbi:hypothetical protein GGP41_001159 [Bipolaris sorokiniana]|uniref:Uncharacterized protein n=1 Tax=Cochliobolus sativus TaxID=45130 RepID=A0A8H6DRE8_COCSA|nr:hypothetical protein GGP41_001159 [Bipolaris sorokiniana]
MPHLPGVSKHRRTSLTSSRSSSIDETRRHDGGEDVTKEDETIIDPEQGNSASSENAARLAVTLGTG